MKDLILQLNSYMKNMNQV